MQEPLVLWGGVDVNTSLYDQQQLSFTQNPNKERDFIEITAIQEAIDNGVPVVGVCRGAQLLCVVNGGSLYQHSRPHVQDHSLSTLDGKIFERVSAGHHQIMRPTGEHIVYAWNPSNVIVWVSEDVSYPQENTAEVVWFPKTKCLAIQPHPEWANKGDSFVTWVNNLMAELEINYEF